MLKALLKRLTCRHKEYEFLCDFSMRHIPTNRRYHEVTIKCCNCGKEKQFNYFKVGEKE